VPSCFVDLATLERFLDARNFSPSQLDCELHRHLGYFRLGFIESIESLVWAHTVWKPTERTHDRFLAQ
jgi:hypothetical protein